MAQFLRPCFRRLGVAVFGAHLFLGVFALEFASFVDPSAWWWLAPFCIVSLTMLGYLVYRALAAQPAGILYESGLFLSISCAVYYAFGPLLFRDWASGGRRRGEILVSGQCNGVDVADRTQFHRYRVDGTCVLFH